MTFTSKLVKRGFTIVIFAIILYASLMIYSDIKTASNVFSKINYSLMFLVFPVMTTNLFFLSLRFARLVEILGIKIPMVRRIMIYFASLALLATPFGSGQLIKSELIRRETNEPISKTAPIFFIEKWTELVAVLILLITFTIFRISSESIVIIAIGILLSVFFVIMVKNDRVFYFTKKFLGKFRIFKKIEENIDVSKNSFKTALGIRVTMEGVCFVVVAKLLEVFAVMLTFNAVGIQLDFYLVAQIYFISIVSGILVFIPGGLLVTEGSMISLLVKYGYDLGISTPATILARLVTLWYSTVLGFIVSKKIVKRW